MSSPSRTTQAIEENATPTIYAGPAPFSAIISISILSPTQLSRHQLRHRRIIPISILNGVTNALRYIALVRLASFLAFASSLLPNKGERFSKIYLTSHATRIAKHTYETQSQICMRA